MSGILVLTCYLDYWICSTNKFLNFDEHVKELNVILQKTVLEFIKKSWNRVDVVCSVIYGTMFLSK